jgi:hypothetical protein
MSLECLTRHIPLGHQYQLSYQYFDNDLACPNGTFADDSTKKCVFSTIPLIQHVLLGRFEPITI